MKKHIFNWLPVALFAAWSITLIAVNWHRVVRGQNDFVSFYVGGKLAGTPKLYSQSANAAAIQSILGITMEKTRFIRPPFYAVLYMPISRLPYPIAYALYCVAILFSVLWFTIRFSKECPSLPLFAAMSVPLLTALETGQDTPFLLVFVGVSVLLTRRGKDFLAGLVLSLCAIKFHLFLFVPVLLLMKRRWRLISGGICGGAVLACLGLMFAGANSFAQWVDAIGDPSTNSGLLPNIHGLVTSIHAGLPLELTIDALILVAFVLLTATSIDYELLLGASVVCGLLTSFHSGVYDAIVLLVVFVLVIQNTADVRLRLLAAFIVSPIPYLLLWTLPPFSAVLPLSLLAVIGLLAGALPAHETARIGSQHAGGRNSYLTRQRCGR